MLRVDNGSFLENSKKINYAKRPADKCIQRKEEVEAKRKAACDPNADAVKMLDDFHRKNACSVHTCVPQKKCMAKVGLHDSNGNFLYEGIVGTNMTPNLRVGGNQIGYVYQEKSINNFDALADALRENNPVGASVAMKVAQSNAELFGKPHAWDGSDMGHFCVKCPPIEKPCPREICKKADPLFNPEIGMGSDGLQAKEDLRELRAAQVFQERQAAMATTAVGETLGGEDQVVGRDRGRPRGTQSFSRAQESVSRIRAVASTPKGPDSPVSSTATTKTS